MKKLFYSLVLCVCFLPFFTEEAKANPNGESVVSGVASFNRFGSTLEVTTTDRAIISWQDFSIGTGEFTQFFQPGSSSSVLNRVTSGISSSLLGALKANGQVYLINPNGILVGPGAQIHTASFIASTLDVSNADFLAGGDLNFVGNSTEKVENLGIIEAIGGDIFLIARTVENSGTLHAIDGVVGLAAGQEILIQQAGNERVFVKPVGSNNATQTGVLNTGTIEAAQVELKAHGNIYALAIKNEGIVRATGATVHNGRILLTAEGGNILNTGILSAKQGENGGEVRLNANKIVNDGTIESKGEKGGLIQLEGKERVTLTGDSITSAKAKGLGKGGDVLVRAMGTETSAALFLEDALIDVQGGNLGGDGGFIDVSGKGFVFFKGKFDLRANEGYKGGELLIDPRDAVVENVVGGGRTFITNTPLGDPSPWNPAATSDGNDLQIGFGEYTTGTDLSLDPRAGGSFANGRFGNGSTVTINVDRDFIVNDTFNINTATGSTNVGLTVNANRHINLNNNVTTSGTTNLTADADGNGVGNFNVADGFTLNTTSSALQIKANDFNLNTTGALNSGTASTTILISDAGKIRVGTGAANMTISGAEMQNITATGLIVGDNTNNKITVRGVTAANVANITGSVTLNATQAGKNVQFETAASTFKTLVVNAGKDIKTKAGINLTTTEGAITWTASNKATFDTGITTSAAGMTVTAGGDVRIKGNVNASGAVTLTADSDSSGAGNFIVDTGVTVNTNGNTLKITSNDITLTGTGALNSGASSTTLLVSDGGTIGLGDTLGNFTLSGSELQNITATGLVVGDNTNGNITVDNITAANSNNIAGTVTLNATAANRSITFQNNTSTFNALSVNAGDDINVNIGLVADTGNILLRANNDVAIGGLGSVTTLGGGNVNIVVDNQFPTTPLLGTGRFINNGAVIAGGRFRIYTVKANQNTLGTLVVPSQQFLTYFGDAVNFAGSGILFKVAAPSASSPSASTVAALSPLSQGIVVVSGFILQTFEQFISSYNLIQEWYQASEYDYKERFKKSIFDVFYIPRKKTLELKKTVLNRLGPFFISSYMQLPHEKSKE